MFLIMYVDEIGFSQPTYEVIEDEGSFCIELILDKPALFDTTVEVNDEIVSGVTSKHM